jgi:hypothetical protein
VLAAGAAAAVLARALPDMPPLAGFLARGAGAVAAYAGVLWWLGFFRPTERAFVREMTHRLWHKAVA